MQLFLCLDLFVGDGAFYFHYLCV